MSEESVPVTEADPLTVCGPVGRTAPATWGQEYMWEILDVLGRGGAALNCRNSVRIPDGMPRAEIMAHLATLFARHEVLRTRFEGDTLGAVTQVVDAHQSLPVSIMDAAGSSSEAARLRLSSRLAEAWFDVARDPLARIGIVERDGRPESVVLVTSHILMDAMSQFMLETDLERLLHGRPLSPAVATQPIEQADYETSPAGRRQAAAAMRYWEKTLDRFPATVAADGASPADSPRYNHGMLTRPRGFAALRRAAAAHRVSQAAVALSALVFVLGRASGLSQYPMLIRSSNRLGAASRSTIGHFAQAAPILIDLAGADVGRLFATVQRDTIVAVRHGLYPPAELARLRHLMTQRRGAPVPLRMTMNYVPTFEEPGSPPLPAATEDADEDRFDWIGGGDHENLAAYCNVWDFRRAVSLHTDSTFLPAARIEPALREMIAFIEYAAAGHTDLTAFDPAASRA